MKRLTLPYVLLVLILVGGLLSPGEATAAPAGSWSVSFDSFQFIGTVGDTNLQAAYTAKGRTVTPQITVNAKSNYTISVSGTPLKATGASGGLTLDLARMKVSMNNGAATSLQTNPQSIYTGRPSGTDKLDIRFTLDLSDVGSAYKDYAVLNQIAEDVLLTCSVVLTYSSV